MATAMLDDESAKKVFRQVEFYFGDFNLPKDRYLMNSISESEDGMVNLSLICSFSKMKSHLGLGALKAAEIPDEVIKAVAETLKPSELLKISDDGKKVGRKTELAKVEQQVSRTIAVSPLPYDVTREDIESFFTQHAKVNCVRLPGHVSNKKLFCGTALVEFSSDEDMEKMLKQTLAYAGVDLELKPKKEFDVEREKQIAECGDVQATSAQSPEKPSYPKGLIVAFALKSNPSKNDEAKPAELEKAEKASEEEKDGPSVEDRKENANDTTNAEADGKEAEDEKKSPEDANEDDEKRGASEERFSYNSCKDNMDVVLREDLKAVFGKFGTVKYVDFSAGEVSGYIQFEEPEAFQKARAAAVLSEEGGLVVKNFIATLEPVTGEAEKEFWSKYGSFKERFRDNRGGRSVYNRQQLFDHMHQLSLRQDDMFDRQMLFYRQQQEMRETLANVAKNVRDLSLFMDKMRQRQEDFYRGSWPTYPHYPPPPQ